MSVQIKTTHGTYRGQSVESIIRREYGRRAEVLPHSDPNSPNYGDIVTKMRGSQPPQYTVEARLFWVEKF